MMDCPKCKKVLDDGVKFCDACGTELEQAEVVAESASKKKKFSKKMIAVLISATSLLLVVAIVVGLALSLGGGANYGLYIKDGELYYTDFSKNGRWQVTGNLAEDRDNEFLAELQYSLSFRTRISADGKMLFYVDEIDDYGDCTLYVRGIKDGGQAPVKIDTGVYSYDISENGKTVIYVKDDALYKHNLRDKEKLDEDVEGFFMTKDAKKIAYFNYESTLYIKRGSQEKEEISSCIDHLVYYTEDLNTIYYIKSNDLYKWEDGKDSVKLVDDVYDVFINNEKDKFYFIREEQREVLAKDYIFDDVKDSDAAFTIPEYPRPPRRSDYKDMEKYNADYEAYLEAFNNYNQKINEYYKKCDRDAIRAKLENQKITLTNYTLCYFDGQNALTVTDNISRDNLAVSYTFDAAVYQKYTNDLKAWLSDISSVNNIVSAVEECLHSHPQTSIAIHGMEASLSLNGVSEDFTFSEDGKTLYYIDEIDEDTFTGNVYALNLSKGVGEATLYDSGIDCELGIEIDYVSGDIYYYKNTDDDLFGTLYINGKCIAEGVGIGSLRYNEADNSYVFFTDYDVDKGEGTLNISKKGKLTKISDYVCDYTISPKGEVLYLYDYRYEDYTGDLYIFNGRKVRKLDTDVTALLDVYTYYIYSIGQYK